MRTTVVSDITCENLRSDITAEYHEIATTEITSPCSSEEMLSSATKLDQLQLV